jgi:hypothetical protein
MTLYFDRKRRDEPRMNQGISGRTARLCDDSSIERRIGRRSVEWSPVMLPLSLLLTVVVLVAYLVDFATERAM